MRFTFIAFTVLAGPAFAQIEECPTANPLADIAKLCEQGSKVARCAAATKMDVQGHRGIEGYPNNTIPSFVAGVKAGSDTIELDLQITKDDEVIVGHDPTLDPKRCSLPGGKPLKEKTLRKMNWKDAKGIVCAEKELGRGSVAPMPTLGQTFKALDRLKGPSGAPARLNIEIKYQDNREFFPTREEYAEKILAAVRKSGWKKDRYFIQSFDHDMLNIVKTKAEAAGMDVDVVPLVGDAKDAVAAAEKTGAKTVTSSFTQLTPAIVADLQARGVKVVPWTVNSEADMNRMIDLGVDGIITDRADLFTKIRKDLCRR